MERAVEKLGTRGAAEPASAADALAPLSLQERLSAEIASLKELDLDLHVAMGTDGVAVVDSGSPATQRPFLEQHLERLTVHRGKLEIRFRRSEQSAPEVLSIPQSSFGFQPKRQIILSETTPTSRRNQSGRNHERGSLGQSQRAAIGSHSSWPEKSPPQKPLPSVWAAAIVRCE